MGERRRVHGRNGRVEGQQQLKVKVPDGIDEGMRLRLAGEGEAGIAGGPPGDLFVVVSFRPHPLFERDGPDLHCQVPVSFVQATLGDEIEVPTLEGKVTLKIPPGTQSDKVFRLRGKGVRSVRGGNVGDLLCRVRVETPVNLTAKQKGLLEELRDTFERGGSKHSPQERSWLDGVKAFFDDMRH